MDPETINIFATVQSMKILSVIPILKGVAPETLTYYSSADVRVGALVRVPIRGTSVCAIVTRVDEASSNKADIKRLAFTLKKIDGVVAEQCFSDAFMSAVTRVADYHAAALGPTLSVIVPRAVLEHCAELMTSTHSETFIVRDQRQNRPKLIQGSRVDRIARYKALIRESFAKHKSIIVIAPSVVEAATLFADLSHGISDRAFFMATTLSTKKLIFAWREALDAEMPIVIVGTSSTSCIPRHDIGTFIVEHESSPHYKTRVRPFVDARIVVLELANALGAEMVWGDTFARMETITQSIAQGDEGIRPSLHQDRSRSVAVVNMNDDSKSNEKKQAMSSDALTALAKAAAMGQRSFVYTLRKGHSGFTVCRDCGTVLACDRCSAPMVLHLPKQGADGDAAERIFTCHRCGRVRDTNTVCDGCSSWRLEMYGLGVEKVAETLGHDLPDISLFVMSADTVATATQARKLMSEWKASGNGILIGTDTALSYLRGEMLGTTVIASVDTLLALPDIGMPERVFRLIGELADASETLIIQTRSPDAAVFSHGVTGDGWAFYQQEIEKRKMLSYPPYTTLIKVTRRGDEPSVMRDLGMIHEMSLPYQTVVYPAFIARVKDIYHAHALISIPRESWPDERLLTQLRGLPPAFIVDVAPESVL